MARSPGVLIQRDVPAKMRDGTTLMSNVYRPAGGGGFPVLLTRLPYGKDFPSDGSVLDPVRAAEAGYIVVVQDVRGRYRSEGRFVPFVAEYEDGYDTVEWAAKLIDLWATGITFLPGHRMRVENGPENHISSTGR